MVRGESKIRHKIRWAMLPYGIWNCADGRRVLFNRYYRALWQKDREGAASPADPDEFVKWCSEHHFYDDGTKDKAQRAIRVYEAFTRMQWDWEAVKEAFRNIDQRLCRTIGSAPLGYGKRDGAKRSTRLLYRFRR